MLRPTSWASLFLLALALAGCVTASGDGDTVRISRDGKRCVEADDKPDSVIATCNRAIDQTALADDAKAMVLMRRGFAFLEKDQLADARQDFESAARLAPTQPEGHIGLALANMRERKLDAAILDYDRAIAVRPNSVRTLLLRAAAWRQAGNVPKARSDVDQAMLLEPRNPAALSARGTLRRLAGDLDGAVSDLDLALGYEAGRRDALESRGHVRFLRGDFAGAAQDFDKARDSKAVDIDRTLWLIVASMRAGDPRASDRKEQLRNPMAVLNDARGAMIGLVLGRMNVAELEAAIKHPDLRIAQEQECTVMFFAGEFRLQEGDKVLAKKLLHRAADTGATHLAAHAAAVAELARIDDVAVPAQPHRPLPVPVPGGRAI